MSHHPTQSKRLLSQVIANWACSLEYEDLSPKAIQAAKLFWFDSIGCALGGSQQEDAKILLKHYRAMIGNNGRETRLFPGLQNESRASRLFEWPHDPLDGLQRHLLKADPCHPSDLIAASLALVKTKVQRERFNSATVIATKLKCAFVKSGVRVCANTVASRNAERLCRPCCGGPGSISRRNKCVGHGISAREHFARAQSLLAS
jgi:hypothetical protein